MTDPFERASRRIIRRLGVPVGVVTASGVRLDAIKGVFSNPESDALVKGRGGGLEFKHRRPTLRVMSVDVEGVSKHWRFFVGGHEYFAADDHADGHGCTLLYLAKALEEPDGSEVSGGTKWR